ncbi:MAG: formylglycine-generating enzyme family protein, partial [Anaerolineae bacterium]
DGVDIRTFFPPEAPNGKRRPADIIIGEGNPDDIPEPPPPSRTQRRKKIPLPPTRPSIGLKTPEDLRPSEQPKPDAASSQQVVRRGFTLARIGIIGLLLAVIGVAVWSALTGTLPPPFDALVNVQGASPAPAAQISPNSTATPTATVTPTPLINIEVPTDTLTPSPEQPAGDDRIISIPGGTFTMGIPGSGVASPTHAVTLSPFDLDRTEVTNAQWQACVNEGACDPPVPPTGYNGDPYFGEEDFSDYPVVNVDWFAAASYCEWQGGRLPTEAEWEMAARWDPETGEVFRYPWGDEPDPQAANFCDENCPFNTNPGAPSDGFAQTAPVGSFPDGASPSGALDMAGNVAEWVADWFGSYPSEAQTDPTGPASGSLRVVRGGAWGVSLEDLNSVARSRFAPDSRSAGLGFRCVYTP